MLRREEIRIRDPFIYTDRENGCYYMYGTTALGYGTLAAKDSFDVYRSYDLEHFEEPRRIFEGSKIGFWADRDFWAPELHRYKGKYYLFASCKAEGRCRATQIFVCDRPDGSFIPLSKEPATPPSWECLDGTFFIDRDKPYMVFSHEWTQIGDGEICAVELTEDLKHAVGEPFVLFKASENKNVSPYSESSFVTDGPFLYREGDKIKMIWSSFFRGRYLVLDAEADRLDGEWRHGGSLFDFDGGHAMIFETLDGKRMLSLHSPNTAGNERACFYEFR